jgi:Xaa-Pro aminopeptidase
MEEARRVKTTDEINCLKMAGAIVDIAWAQVIEKMRPGMRETEIGAVAMEAVWKNGIEATGLPAVRSGPNTAPNYLGRSPQDRIVQPGDLVFIDLWGVTYMGYKTCYYRTFKVGTKPSAKEKDLFKRCREFLYRGLEELKAGNTTADVARAWPTCHDLGYANEFLAADSAIGHNIGLVQYEPPIIARMNSIEDPMVLEAGMTIAMETWAGEPGIGGCRLENVYLVTETGCENLYAMPDTHIIVPPHSIYDLD